MINGKEKAEKATDVAAIKKRIEDKDIKSTLLSVIDASEDLLTELVGEEVLDDSLKDDILAISKRTEVNKRLLDWLSSKDDVSTFETFLAKLRQHGQSHVANLLNGTPGEQPLTTKKRQNIQKIMGDLTKSIDPDSGLLNSLVSVGAISETVYDEITAERTKASRTRALLNSLLRGSDKAFDKFLDILMKYQPLAMEIIDKQEGEMTRPHAETVKGSLEVLRRCTDISLLTIAILRSMGVIDMGMEDGLKLQQGLEKINSMYHWLMRKPVDVYQAFIRAMQENEQKHVANLLSRTSAGQQPMSSEKFDRLIRQRPHLMRGIHSKGIELASALRSQRASEDTDFAISHTDYEDIIAQKENTNICRNSVLIGAVLRRTDFSFDSLREALIQTSQGHLADSMIEGEIVGAHINTTRPDKEDDISKLLNDRIADPKSCEGKHELKKILNELNGFHIPIVSAEAKHSIMIYTYCKTPEDMKSYVGLLNSGRLQTVFENILNLLLKELEGENFQPLQTAVTIEEEDRTLIQQFTGLDENETDFKHLPIISSKNCSAHNYPMNFYCFDCKMGICSSCVHEDHQSHKHSDVQSSQICKAPDNICEQLQQDLALVSSYKSNSLQWKEKIKKERDQMILSMEESEKIVLRRCEDLKQRVERFQEILLQDRAAFKQQMLDEMDIRQRAIDSYVAVYNGYEEHTKNLMEHGSPSEICQSFFGLHERAQKLRQLPEPLINKGFFEKTNEWINRMPQVAVQVGIFPTVGMAQVVHQEIPQPQRSFTEQERRFLENSMDPFSGLLEELTLPRKDAKTVDNEHTLQKKNAKLLDYITKNNKDKDLIRALKNTKQSHIVNFINSNGIHNPQFGGDWPLSYHEIQILEVNRKYLVDQLQSRPLLDKLHAAQVISKKQKDFISEKSSFRERNEALLDLLKRGSQDNYKKMVGCLLASDQRNIVQILAPPQVNVTICLDVSKELTELVGSVNQLIAAY